MPNPTFQHCMEDFINYFDSVKKTKTYSKTTLENILIKSGRSKPCSVRDFYLKSGNELACEINCTKLGDAITKH